MDKGTTFLKKKTLRCGGKLITIDKPLVMGILNITPDSFFDGGKHNQLSSAISQTQKMINEGADIVDIGAVSTRPGAKHIEQDEEISRIIPVLEEIKKEFPKIIISVDTWRSEVAERAIESGADIINDISGGQLDSAIYEIAGKYHVPYILMHMQGTPQNMQINPTYQNLMQDITLYFSEKIARLKEKGVNDVIIDPGFGFGKTLEHNYEILSRLKEFEMLDAPILAGVSRKSMINKVLETKPEEALNGTTVLNTLALNNGADILRVHDVKEAKEAVKLYLKYAGIK